MRVFISLFLGFLLISAPVWAEASTKPLPRLKVSGNHLETPDGQAVTLRGVSLCSLEWHKPLEQIHQVTASKKAWPVNVVRLPVQTKEWQRIGPANYLLHNLDPAVKMCTKNNVYCIIDWHQISDWNKTDDTQMLQGFWRMVAPRYADNPNIMYEVFNEPIAPGEQTRENWLAWKKVAEPWVKDIRKAAPDTVVMMGSPVWSKMPSFAAADPFADKNLMYVLHLYPNIPPKDWDGLFGTASQTIPIIMTEWGWSSQKKHSKMVFAGSVENFGEPLKQYLADKPQISWTAWAYDPKCSPAMLGEDADLAKFVKDWLQETK